MAGIKVVEGMLSRTHYDGGGSDYWLDTNNDKNRFIDINGILNEFSDKYVRIVIEERDGEPGDFVEDYGI